MIRWLLRARRTLENDPALAGVRNGADGDGVRVEDVAALLGRDVQEVAQLLAMAETPRSLDAVVDRSDDEYTLGEFMADELALDPTGVTQNHEVERLLSVRREFPPREAGSTDPHAAMAAMMGSAPPPGL